MKELYRICTGENHHKFGTDGGKGHFMNIDSCPFCKQPLETIEVDERPQRKNYAIGVRDPAANGFFRGEFIDTLNRLPWFGEIVDYNDEKQTRSGEIWYKKEAKQLGEQYKLYGTSDVETWKNIAETIFKRSLASVERQLRAVIVCLKEEKTFEELFPDI